MVDTLKQYGATHPRTKKVVGWVLVVFGFLSLITPLTPGGSLFFVGLEILGLRLLFMAKIQRVLKRERPSALLPEVRVTRSEVTQ